MKLFLPVYIEQRASGQGDGREILVRPLHSPEPSRKGAKLSLLLNQLKADLQTRLIALSNEPSHHDLARWCNLPEYETRRVTVRLELKSGSSLRAFFLAGYKALDRWLYFTPLVPELHFELLPGQRLAERAAEVFNAHFRDLEKRESMVDLDEYSLPPQSDARMTVLEVDFNPKLVAAKSQPTRLNSIFEQRERMEGETELRKVGRHLNSLYPQDLPRAVGRDAEVDTLQSLLRLPGRRAIVLVGPRQVGKTALIYEVVRRMMQDAEKRKRRQFWFVSPMRLISGMMYVGQWEERVRAICDFLEVRDSVLCLDDLPGLLTAGRSSGSEMNVAQLLKPRLETRSLRVLAEITPEAWRRLRERDRAFADLFEVIHLAEPAEEETLRILVSVARDLERQHRCEFTLDVVPTAYELHRRFAADAAFPGKAAAFLQRLAVKYAGGACSRPCALEEFRERSGLHLALLDNSRSLERLEIVWSLRQHATGQDAVLEAFADVLLKLKARLNDPRRPLAAFLLLGPTGVGKTQCAKALATHLFGSPERLLRFDMNEMVDGGAVLRLTGTPADPDGLLTGAIRRQPFSVVLFDEIEKAAPEVFDMLLGVLDEGRLSDALGRVADFTSSVILLTSNLGVREAGVQAGFAPATAAAREESFVKAAEKFFRPEFFNRLDRVLPFRELSQEDLTTITRRLLADLLRRDGLRQRRCMFSISPEAATRLVELGHHPQLGARALKRVIEQQVAQPLAVELAARVPGTPLRLHLGLEEGRFILQTQELRPVPRHVFWPEQLSRGQAAAGDVLDAAFDALDRLEEQVEKHAPKDAVDISAVSADQARYFHSREQIRRVERLLKAARHGLEERTPKRGTRALSVPRPKATKLIVRQYHGAGNSVRFEREKEAELLESELDEEEPPSTDLSETPLFAAVRELALLEQTTTEPYDDGGVLLTMHSDDTGGVSDGVTLLKKMSRFIRSLWGMAAEEVFDEAVLDNRHKTVLGVLQMAFPGLWCSGPNAGRVAALIEGGYLVETSDDSPRLLRVLARPCGSLQEARDIQSRPPPPPPEREVIPVRFSDLPDDRLLDHTTGLAVTKDEDEEEPFRAFMLSALPLPAELAAVFAAQPPPENL